MSDSNVILESQAHLLSVRIYRIVQDCEERSDHGRADFDHIFAVFNEYGQRLINMIIYEMIDAGILETEPDMDANVLWLNTVPVTEG